MNFKTKGGTTIEFAMTALIFLVLLMAIIDFSYMFFVNLTMQHAVREGARYALTGQSDLDPNPQGTAQDRCDATIARIKDASMGFFDRASSVVVFKTVNSDGSITPVPSNSCAAANQIIVITVNCELPLISPLIQPFFPNGKYTFSASSTMKNEAF
jgi:Flp pilus assembly protein TadG